MLLNEVRQARADYFREHDHWPKEVRMHPETATYILDGLNQYEVSLVIRNLDGDKLAAMEWYKDDSIPRGEFRFA